MYISVFRFYFIMPYIFRGVVLFFSYDILGMVNVMGQGKMEPGNDRAGWKAGCHGILILPETFPAGSLETGCSIGGPAGLEAVSFKNRWWKCFCSIWPFPSLCFAFTYWLFVVWDLNWVLLFYKDCKKGERWTINMLIKNINISILIKWSEKTYFFTTWQKTWDTTEGKNLENYWG